MAFVPAPCRGHNGQGALGTGGGDTSSPTAVADPGPFTFMTAARRYTCATKAEGTAWCWGLNDRQLVGSSTSGSIWAPVPVYWWPVATAPVFSSIYASKGDSYFTCALDNSTQAYCWVSLRLSCPEFARRWMPHARFFLLGAGVQWLG